MARPSQIIAQRDFSAGQLDETAARRDDAGIFRAGLRKARNVRLLNAGGFVRRPGRRWIYKTPNGGITDLIRPTAGEWWWVDFQAGQITFRRRAPTATAPQTFTGMPWTAPQVTEMRWACSGNTLIVVHQTFRPWTFVYNSTTQTWTQSVFAFAQDANGETREPFRQLLAGSGIKMQPSARSGTITVTFTGPVLNAGHVGVRFRYGEQQMIITAVTNATTATATVVSKLAPTYQVGFNTVEGLQAGDVIEGVDSNARGNVLSVNPGTTSAIVVVTKNWSGFQTSEIVAGPLWKGTVSSSTEVAPGASLIWDEAFMSNYRGWPGSVAVDQQRVIFTRFKQYGPAVVWSATGALDDFRPGADADDAIFEFAPENSTVYEVVGGPDEFILTDTAVYYIPISSSSPLKPGSVEFREVGTIGSAAVRPVRTSDGFLFLNASRSRIIAVQSTGQAARPYIADDSTQFHSDLLRAPVCLAVTTSDVTAPERYIYVVNSDGTMAVGRYEKRVAEEGWIGWVPWDGAGMVKWVAAGGADVALTVEYAVDAGPNISGVEVLDDELLLDASIDVTTTFNPSAANWLTSTEVSLETGGWYRGEITAPASGTIASQLPVTLPALPRLGKSFVVEVEPFVPQADMAQNAGQRLTRRRISQVGVKMIRSQAVEIAGRDFPFWYGDENQELAPPLREETRRVRPLGRDFDPRWSLKQVLPGALTVLEMTTEVTV